MSTVPDQNDVNLIEQARRQINRLAEEIAHLSESDLAPPAYYGEFLQRILQAVAAPAGAVWLITQQGNLQQQCQINVREVGLDSSEKARESHDELLRQAITRMQPYMLPPRSSFGVAEGNRPVAGNPTSFHILLAPIVVDKQVAGLLEVWQDANRSPAALHGFMEFLKRMAGLAAGYARNHQLRQMVGQEQVWTQLEAFARQIHNSLNPTEVAYLVANEGRRLAECDRMSVGIKLGGRTKVEAISGADVVEKRSNLVQLMRKLMDSVLKWGEKLVYTGVKDDALPPNVLGALDDFLAESTSKFLVVLPLKDEREAEGKRPARSALLMESFDPTLPTEQMVARLEVIGKHATTALYNATEYKRIPFRFVWMPIAKLQEGLGGKAKAITTLALVAVLVLIAVLIFVPYPLKMEADGQLWPIGRPYIFAPMEGMVEGFPPGLKPGDRVAKGQELIYFFAPDMVQEITQVTSEIVGYDATIKAILSDKNADPRGNDINKKTKLIDATSAKNGKESFLKQLRDRYQVDPFRPGSLTLRSPIDGVVLTPDFKDKLTGLSVKQTTPLIRIGKYNPDPTKTSVADWEIELKIPQKHIGQVLKAYDRVKSGEDLDVDIVLKGIIWPSFKGKLARRKIAGESTPNKDDNNESEPVTLAWVRISGNDIPEAYRIPAVNLLAGEQARTRIRCGDRPMGYSLFYGVWEFLYENVVFRFF